MKLVTYCDQPGFYGFEFFQQTASRYGWDPIVLTTGKPFTWEGRLEAVWDFCKQQPGDEIILFTDCFDILFLALPEEVEAEFLKFNSPLVFSAERNCYPDPALSAQFPPSPTTFRHLCAGAYIGRARAIAEMMAGMGVSEMRNIPTDQGLVSQWYIANQERAKLDHECIIFQSYYDAALTVKFRDGRVLNSETGTYSLIFHANGKHHDRDIGRCFSKIFGESV